MEPKEASIRVRGVECLETVAEVVLCSKRSQSAGLILKVRGYHQPFQSHSLLGSNSFQLSCFHTDHRQDRVEYLTEEMLSLDPSFGQQMRLTVGKPQQMA